MLHYRIASLFVIVTACLGFSPVQALGQEGYHADAATMVMAGDLEFTDLEVPGFDSGMKLAVLYGDFTVEGPYSLRLSFPDGYRFPPHFHPMAENLTVLSGTLLLAMGDKADESRLVSYGAGDFLNIQAKHPHFGGAKGYTVLQLHGIGPFEIILVE